MHMDMKFRKIFEICVRMILTAMALALVNVSLKRQISPWIEGSVA